MIQITTAHNTSRLQGSLNFLTSGTGTAKIQIYGTTRPALAASAGASPLVEIPLTSEVGSIVGGALVLAAAADGLIATSGTAVWARVLNRNGEVAFDCDVSATGGAGEVQLPDTALYAGGLARLVSAVLG